MNKKIIHIITIKLILISILVFPLIVLGADTGDGGASTDANADAAGGAAGGLTITGIVANVGSVIGKVAVFLTIMFWIITGLLFLMARGDPSGLGKAKLALFAAIGGTAICVLAATAQGLISTALTTGF
jgi:hypothetical protein